jgi:hypothetical protein
VNCKSTCRLPSAILAVYMLITPFICSCQPFQLGKAVSDIEHMHHSEHGRDVGVCETPTVEALAHDLDKLEANVEKYGSVVAKQPDVWGQARLTKYREEFEQQMAAQLNQFGPTLQGSVSESDQAYFADAFALSAAASPRTRPLSNAPASSSSSSSSSSAPSTSSSKDSSSSASTTPPVPASPPADVFGAFSSLTRTQVNNGPALQFADAPAGIKLEPTVLLDERARFLNHLQELRRINEGDDTADSPGYALNLVRIPMSVLPGKLTDIGYGAEITITMKPYLSEDLLPTTFRNLVMNDLVDQLGFPITEFINNPRNVPYFDEKSAEDMNDLLDLLQDTSWEDLINDEEGKLRALRWKPGLQSLLIRPEWSWIDKVLNREPENCQPLSGQTNARSTTRTGVNHTAFDQPGIPERIAPGNSHRRATVQDGPDEAPMPPWNRTARNSSPNENSIGSERFFPAVPGTLDSGKYARLLNMLNREAKSLINVQVPIPSTKSRRARLPFPPSEIFDVYGFDFVRLAVDADRGLANEPFAHPSVDTDQVFIHLPDVQGYLQEELSAAYKFLAENGNEDLWKNFCTPALVNAVLGHNAEFLEKERLQFNNCVETKTTSPDLKSSTREALAWAIIVDSALLTDQLVQDMQESAAAKGCGCGGDVSLPYFLPNPPSEARQAFNDYVSCRWPIHAFALDPAAQQQNIADVFSGRREMQLAMSMAFVSGRLSANNMMRYARRIEYDFSTIDLNGTEIGFSHGNETFGWRFYPRFQTPDIESNSTVFFRDLLVGGPSRNALLKQRRLEPGIRECYAIVIMPSFVPYATFNASSNWFKLTNPKAKVLDSTDAMRLSKLVKGIETCGPHIVDGGCYREGDLQRLVEKAKQLETRLPLQSTMVQIPYENTLGGFSMFNTGVTDLAPELSGWYGAEAIDPSNPTTLFLVGNHFSVHQTKIIAGGQNVSDTEMLSRQVIQVTIPAKPSLVNVKKQQTFVDVQLATPYGVTQHLLIPAVKPSNDDSGATGGSSVSANAAVWKTPTLEMAFVYAGLGITPPSSSSDPQYRPLTLLLAPGTVDPKIYDQVDVALAFDKKLGGAKMTISGNAYDSTKKCYVIPGAQVVSAVFKSVGNYLGPEATNPAISTTITTAVTFKSSQNAAPDKKDQKTSNDLTINFDKSPK